MVRRDLNSFTSRLSVLLESGEIDQEQYQEMVAKAADEMLQRLDPAQIAPEDAWRYAELLRAAQRWEETRAALEVAIRHAEETDNWDRRVNDTLRLAQALAHLDQVPEAIATARRVFDAPTTESVPILPATLYEIAPAAAGKGQDEEVARLLEDAIGVHLRTEVDFDEPHGRAFILARPIHIRNAWLLVQELYIAAGNVQAAREAGERAAAMMRLLRPGSPCEL